MLENHEVATLIGTVVFLLSGVLPLVSLNLFDFSYYFSLFNAYILVIQGGSLSSASFTVTAGSVGVRLMIILYPVALILGIVSIFKRRIAAVAGILGLMCWIGWATSLIEMQEMSYAGLALYVGFLGAVIFLVAYALKPTATAPLAPPPPARAKAR
jgi:hypothetical protein